MLKNNRLRRLVGPLRPPEVCRIYRSAARVRQKRMVRSWTSMRRLWRWWRRGRAVDDAPDAGFLSLLRLPAIHCSGAGATLRGRIEVAAGILGQAMAELLWEAMSDDVTAGSAGLKCERLP